MSNNEHEIQELLDKAIKLALIVREGTRAEVAAAIEQNRDWLDKIDDDLNEFTAEIAASDND